MIAAPPVVSTERKGTNLGVTLSFHEGQIEAWNATERYVAVIAGTGGGKSVMGAPWLLARALEFPGEEFLALAPTVDMLDRVLVPKLLALAEPLGATYVRNRIDLPNGSIIHLVSAEKPARAEGIHARAAWMDEAGQMDGLMWEVARRRVGQKAGRILLTTTPYDMGWVKVQVFDRWSDGDPAYRVVNFPSTANPTYPREEFERARREMTTERFEMFYLGLFRRASGLVYPDWAPATMLEDAKPPADWRRVGGLDLGWHNATAAVLLAEGPDGQVVIEREHYAAETLLADHATVLKSWGDVLFYADPSAKQSIEELRTLGLNVASASNDVLAGIDAVTRLIRTDRLRAVRGATPHLLQEFESYTWEQKDGKPTDKPRKQDDHCLVGETAVETDQGPQRLDSICSGDYVLTRRGHRRVIAAGMTQPCAAVLTAHLSDGRTLTGTAEHPVWVEGRGFTRMDALRYGDILLACQQTPSSTTEFGSIATRIHPAGRTAPTTRRTPDTAATASVASMRKSGRRLTARFLPATISTISTLTRSTTLSIISPASAPRNISPFMVPHHLPRGSSPTSKRSDHWQPNGIAQRPAESGTASMASKVGRSVSQWSEPVSSADAHSSRSLSATPTASAPTPASQSFVACPAWMTKRASALLARVTSERTATGSSERAPVHVVGVFPDRHSRAVFNLTVDGEPEFFANGILVHNCLDSLRYAALSLQRGKLEPVDPATAAALAGFLGR